MQENPKQKVLKAFLLALRPIIKILLRYGISFSEFAETLKTVFVDVASAEFGIRGRPTNISRVAVMTGLTRKEVRRLRNKLEVGDDEIKIKSTPISEILHRWHAEDDFLDERGRPSALPFSDGEKSFSELVRRFGGDVPPGAMRTELKRVGSIEEDDEGRLRVVRRIVTPPDMTEKLVTSLVHGVYPLLSTVAMNTDPQEESKGLAQFTVFSKSIRKEDVTRLRRISFDRLKTVAESMDDLLMAYESLSDKPEDETGQTLAVGLFYFEEHDTNAKYTW